MRKVIVFLLIAIGGFLVWYLAIRSYDFKVSFKLETTPGTINQVVKSWGKGMRHARFVKQTSINDVLQEVSHTDHTYTYNWEIQLINESTTQVNVYVNEAGNSLLNRLKIPFVATAIETNAEKDLRGFYRRAKEHLDEFKVKIEGINSYDSTFCVYIPLETSQVGKAFGMMGNYSLLSDFVLQQKLETNGVPFVEVTEWNWDSDEIKYNFCYPIIKPDSLPNNHQLLKYKWLVGSKAIKAIYNGNYITSDRAWYALQNFAEQEGLSSKDKPIEFFYNNPNFGGNELDWTAEIYLPIE